jgi:hypothetical protein
VRYDSRSPLDEPAHFFVTEASSSTQTIMSAGWRASMLVMGGQMQRSIIILSTSLCALGIAGCEDNLVFDESQGGNAPTSSGQGAAPQTSSGQNQGGSTVGQGGNAMGQGGNTMGQGGNTMGQGGGHTCLPDNAACQSPAECCSQQCGNGYCYSSCLQDGAFCQTSAQCCSQFCNPNGQCSTPCLANGAACNSPTQCCSQNCVQGHCQ